MAVAFELKFIKKQKVAYKTYSFYFDRSNFQFDFNPGEYVRMTLEIDNPDNRGSSRYFTIASSPNNKKFLVITTKIIQSSFKKELFNLKEGKLVRFFGPLGNFIIDKKDTRPKIFLAGGIGITTFYSMVLYNFEMNLKNHIYLLASFSKPEDTIYANELLAISEKSPNISVSYTVSNADKKGWVGEIGRIDKVKIRNIISELNNPVFYVVGPTKMVDSITKNLKDMRVSSDRIMTEDFSGY